MIINNYLPKHKILGYTLMPESLKYKTVRHYKPKNNSKQLLKVENNRKYNYSDAEYLARIKKNGKWNKKILTGLFVTKHKNIYFGDIINRQGKHLVIFVFSNNRTELSLYIFLNYYPNKTERNKIITQIYNQSL